MNNLEIAQVIREQVQRVHRAVHDGSLDTATVDEALARLNDCAGQLQNDEPAPAVANPAAKPKARVKHK